MPATPTSHARSACRSGRPRTRERRQATTREPDHEQPDPRGEAQGKKEADHRDPAGTRNARASLTGYATDGGGRPRRQGSRGRDRAARRVADPPGHDRSTAYHARHSSRARRGSGPGRPGRQRVSYTCVTASAGVGPGRYAMPVPRAATPSPKRHSTSGTAVTVSDTPASVTETVSAAGAASSQNQDAAPVRPPRAGDELDPARTSGTDRPRSPERARPDRRPGGSRHRCPARPPGSTGAGVSGW